MNSVKYECYLLNVYDWLIKIITVMRNSLQTFQIRYIVHYQKYTD